MASEATIRWAGVDVAGTLAAAAAIPARLDADVRAAARAEAALGAGQGLELFLYVTIGTGIALMEPGSLKGLQLVVSDVEAARKFLDGNGVDVSPVRHVEQATGEWFDGHGGPWNSFIFFDDPDGNSWTVQEKPA